MLLNNFRHWQQQHVSNHAVVVVGFDDQHVFINDPAQPETPLEIGMDTFLLAWSSRNYEYAVICLAEGS